MPTYDYRCTNCGDIFEHFQKMTDAPLATCNKCGGELKRLIGAGLGPIFKGSGFYQTDYKNSSTSNSAAKTADSSSTDKKETKKEIKPEAKKNPA
jgi:putative FmdB family regulatory protein